MDTMDIPKDYPLTDTPEQRIASLVLQLEKAHAKYDNMKGYADSLENDIRLYKKELEYAGKQCFFNDQQARLYRDLSMSQQKELEFLMEMFLKETGRDPYVVP